MLCKNLQTRFRFKALIVHFTYKLKNGGELKGTGNQFRQIMMDRHSIEVENKQLDRLKERYFTRGKTCRPFSAVHPINRRKTRHTILV